MVSGGATPLTLNPAPVEVTWVIVRLAVPVFVTTSGSVFVCPSIKLPKLRLEDDTLIPACTPVPVTPTGLVPPGLTIEIVPLVVADVVGLNCTVNVALCAEAKLTGRLTPLTDRLCPLTAICEIVVALLPVLVMVTVWFAEPPTFTFPKLRDAGLTDNVAVAATPVPLRATTVGEVEALVTRLMLPLARPAVCGANCAVNVLLFPAAIVRGVATPLTLNPAPVELTCATVKSALPVFVMITGSDFVCPSIKLPKLILVGDTLIPG